MKLYELGIAIRDILANADFRDGELTDEELEQLDGLADTQEVKVEVYCKLIREQEADIAARQAEIDRLQAGLTTAENRKERLKDRLKVAMMLSGQRSVETPLFKVWLQNSAPSAKCLVDDPATLAPEFQKVKTTVTANTVHALDVWKTTGTIPEGFEIKTSESLRIK